MRHSLAWAWMLVMGSLPLLAQVPLPEWIWLEAGPAPAGQGAWFRKDFQAPFTPSRAELVASGDDRITVYLNGVEVGSSQHWREPIRVEVTEQIREGANTLSVEAANATAGPAAVTVRLEMRSPNGFGVFIRTDDSWWAAAAPPENWLAAPFEEAAWGKAKSLGTLGMAPWGDVLGEPQATSPETIQVAPGFKLELLKSARADEGSWIAMTIDPRGRIIVSPEKRRFPMWRLTLDGKGGVALTEPIEAPVRGAMGLLYAHDSLYVNGLGPQGAGLYRLRDADGDDTFEPEEVSLLKTFTGDNEHGYHAVALGPGGHLYVLNGNHTLVPDGLDPSSPFRNWGEDVLLQRYWDPNGHARDVLSPGGYVLRTDPEGRHWSLLMGGFRNAYDLDFNTEGELFTFDADMEWDVGCPWYRPNRINHGVSGADFGWRSGSGKWPSYYPDSLPTTLDLGLASPTGVKFGTRSHYPPPYRKAFFVADWNYGKIFAVHLTPHLSSYTATAETFLSGRPLPVTDLEFGPDGAMYFILGGWMLQSGLYRVSYEGPAVAETKPDPVEMAAEAEAARARALRHRLERFHGQTDPAAVAELWPHLGSEDPWLRHAARVALEWQPVSSWQHLALGEEDVARALSALLALARTGAGPGQEPILQRLSELATRNLTKAQALEATRIVQLCFIRLGRPEPAVGAEAARELNRFFPSEDRWLNRELSALLVYLGADDVVTKTLPLMLRSPYREDQIHFAHVLAQAGRGWTLTQREQYFAWLNRAILEFQGGNSLVPYLRRIRQESMDGLTEVERTALAEVLKPPALTPPPWLEAEPRAFVREWTYAEIEPLLEGVNQGRSFMRGRAAFVGAQCVACHRMGTVGGATGPDLTGVSGRFGRRDLLRHIMEPSLVISDRYQTFNFILKDDEEVSGTIGRETDDAWVVVTNPLTGEERSVAKAGLVERYVSSLSAMPEGLLNVLEAEEILDLLAFLEADGKAGHPAFVSRNE